MIYASPVSGIAQGKPVSTTYDPAEQSYIEILEGEEWRPGHFRNWVERGGEQWASIEYGAGRSRNRIALVPISRLRGTVL